MPDFISVARIQDIGPGSAKSFELNGHYIAIYNCGGKFYATSNICKHEGGFLADGELTDKIIMCPLHGWEYKVDTGECLVLPGEDLKTYPVQIVGDEIQVAVE